MKRFLLMTLLCLLAAAPALAQDDLPAIPALAETAPSPGDGTTSAAIWIHPTDPAQSVILGADDNSGVGVYALDGGEIQFFDGAQIGNVDLRYNFPLDDERVTLVAGGVKDEPRVLLWTLDPVSRTLAPLAEIETGIRSSGLCMYVSPITGTYYFFTNSEDGEVEQYAVLYSGGDVVAELERAFVVGTDTEFCAADDELRRVYFGEEEVGLWRYGAEPEDGTSRRLIDIVAGPIGGNIAEEIEGVALVYGADRSGYLLASNEKNNSFLVYERGGDNLFVGEFTIGAGDGIDAVTEPNGFAVSAVPLGDAFPDGLFVTADETNSQPNGRNNFKLASWGAIVEALGLELDPGFDPRRVGLPGEIVAAGDAITVTAAVETLPVPSGTDAADDPAIWIHPTDTAMSTIIGTDKTGGLAVYDLTGDLLQYVEIGRVNNVDLRYNFPLDGDSVALVAATNRTRNSLILYRVNPETRELVDVAAGDFVSDMREVYGICMYISPVSGDYYAFVNSANTGEVEQYLLTDNGAGQVDAELVREFVVGGQTEGCAADDENGALYIGEEAAGVWRYNAEPDADDTRVQVDHTGEGGNLTADVEGMAIYYGSEGAGYLIVSSQGSSEFVVYDREGDNAYLGTFSVIQTEGVDAVSGSDGLDVTNFPLGDAFPDGVFVTQDDLNIDPDDNQNFKLVRWGEIAAALGLETVTDFDPRAVGR